MTKEETIDYPNLTNDELNALLTDKQRAFVDEYLIDLNATQAAIRANYSEKTAQQIGSENLSKPLIQEAITRAMDERSKRTKVDADWLHVHCSDMLLADVGDILDDVGQFKPIHEWPKIWRQMLTGVDLKELYEYDDGKKENIGELVKAKFVSREKILELIGKHVNVGAFSEKQQLELKGKVKLEGFNVRFKKAECGEDDEDSD